MERIIGVRVNWFRVKDIGWIELIQRL